MKKAYCLLPFLFFLMFINPYFVYAAEEKNVDSFNVHPLYRWDVSNTGFTATVESGVLNISDTGDGSQDNYILERELRDMEGRLEFRFKLIGESGSSNYQDAFLIYLYDKAGTEFFRLYVNYIDDDSFTTDLMYSSSSNQQKALSGSERLFSDVWYVYRFDYNILRSEAEYTLYFDNGSKVWSYTWQEINDDYIPDLFSKTDLKIKIHCRSYSNNKNFQYLLDFVEAPFKEREWYNSDVPGDSDLYFNSWQGAQAQDNIDDQTGWRLTVPYFDAVSGIFKIDCEDQTALADDEYANATFVLYTVDYDDGGVTEAVRIELSLEEQYPPVAGLASHVRVAVDGTWQPGLVQTYNDDDGPTFAFSIGAHEDRSELIVQTRFTPDTRNSKDTYTDLVYEVSVADISADASQEFVLLVIYDFDFDGDTEFYTSLFDFDLLYRDLLKDVQGFVDDVFGIGQDFLDGIAEVLGVFFIWLGALLGTVFVAVGDLLKDAIEALQSALDTAISGVQTAVEGLVTHIQAIGEDVIDYLVTTAQDVVDAILDGLIAVVGVVEDLFFAIWNQLTNSMDILAVIDLVWTNFWTTVGKIPTGFADVLAYVDYWRSLISIFIVGIIFGYPALRARGDIGEWLAGIVDTCMVNILPIQILGFSVYIPLGILLLVPIFDLGWTA